MKSIPPDVAPLLTVSDLCGYLKLNRSAVYRLIKSGKLRGFRVGGDWRVDRDEIERWRAKGPKKQDAQDCEIPLVVPRSANGNA
jgi:excisionase family DNA binding protein